MKGSIKAYSRAVNAGVIETTGGQRYQFSKNDWSGQNLPQANDSVIFDEDGRQASNVKNSETA